ncbi:hypothetical protein GCM10027347_55680 [Larkinella harenae]
MDKMLYQQFHQCHQAVNDVIKVSLNNDSVYSQLVEIRNLLSREHITLMFGGYFKAGKSSSLNALLGRPILPVGDDPETGVLCPIVLGDSDTATIHYLDGSCRPVLCTQTGLAQESRLLNDWGKRRIEVEEIHELRITLDRVPIPEKTIWMDTPGIGDTDEMDECAQKATERADLVVWVLTSKQVLSQTEKQFLLEYMSANGPDSVVFVLNCYLEEDSDHQWQHFFEIRMPRVKQALDEFAQEAGIPVPPLFCFSATMGNSSISQSLLEKTREYLTEITTTRYLLSLRPRLFRARVKLDAIQKQLQGWVNHHQTVLDRQWDAYQKAIQDNDVLDQQFYRIQTDYEKVVANGLQATQAQIRQYFKGYAEKIAGSTIRRDATYSNDLTSYVTTSFNQLVTTLSNEVKAFSNTYGSVLNLELTQTKLSQVAGKTGSHFQITIPVTDTPANFGEAVAGGAAAGGVAGSIIPIIGTLWGVVAGAAAGVAKAATEAVKKDVENVQNAITKEADSVASTLGSYEKKFQEALSFNATSKVLPALPDDSELKATKRILTEIKASLPYFV